MNDFRALGLAVAEIGLILLSAVAARAWLGRVLAPGEVPGVLRQRVETIDRRRAVLLTGGTALFLGGVLMTLVG